MPASRPSWQTHECPTWCEGGHREDDHVDDRVHRAVAEGVDVLLDPDTTTTVQLEFAVWRRDGRADTWLYAGSGPGRELHIPLPDAPRVLRSALRLAGVEDDDVEERLLVALARYADPPVRAVR
ncbi:NADPH:quinone reductase-like Zn-dependent oxidoreductase [Microbacterium sp. SORGH_AS428]|uniref:DUF6907 domain-containing protein n=1 Tax=Microbacterium sp. SORGH_AS_0428 TaxID=3041788 RepID=UPI00285F6A75|nr:hypothetical protein [Microbacterium sp. SORGH_AS_0428]MDR6200093.1 NADPH:quinone reductase-like Zn-dependent oxidoreductase [Microbacterium sp. SORGH_AS_0428]